jgi:hypothetical protein
MNDSELETRLKAVPLPERPEDYWEDFPAQVRVNLRRAAIKPAVENLWLPRLVWAGTCAALLLLAFGFAQLRPLQAVSRALSKNELHFRSEFTQFEHQLHVLMRDEHGLHYLIAENE